MASPSYEGSRVEARQGASLILFEGPAGGGKSQRIAALLAAGDLDTQLDYTAIWRGLRAVERDPDGKYPIRRDEDPTVRSGLVSYLKTVGVRKGLREGLRVAVTTSQRGQSDKYRELAEEVGAAFRVVTVDPGIDISRIHLAEADGTLSDECGKALGRWYGEARATRSDDRIRRELLACL